MGLPDEIQAEIQDYFHLTIELRDMQEEFRIFMSLISKSKRDKIENTIFEANLRSNTIVAKMLKKYGGENENLNSTMMNKMSKILKRS